MNENEKLVQPSVKPVWRAIVIRLVMSAIAGLLVSGDRLIAQQVQPESEIARLRARLSSADIEVRRDALLRLAAFRTPAASRAAVVSLRDAVPIIRATAAGAVVALPGDEAVAVLIPVLSDADEFVRREIAFALGRTKSRDASRALVAVFNGEQKPGVRAAMATALGEIGDASAVEILIGCLVARVKKNEDEFVRRTTARTLGLLRAREAVDALLLILTDVKASVDTRREAAVALGLIGDTRAIGALRLAMESGDPYLNEAAARSIAMIEKPGRVN